MQKKCGKSAFLIQTWNRIIIGAGKFAAGKHFPESAGDHIRTMPCPNTMKRRLGQKSIHRRGKEQRDLPPQKKQSPPPANAQQKWGDKTAQYSSKRNRRID